MHTEAHLFSVPNDCLWYDKLWGPSQRVVTLFIFFLEGRETFGFNFWRFYISPGQSSSAGKKLARSRVKGAGGFFSLVVVTFGPSKEKLSLIFTNEDKGMNITVPILSRYGH